jgi:hypothetical protein
MRIPGLIAGNKHVRVCRAGSERGYSAWASLESRGFRQRRGFHSRGPEHGSGS